MISWVRRKFRRVPAGAINAFENTDPDELLCRTYIDFKTLGQQKATREQLVETMSAGCAVLDDLGVRYWIGRGTLLGLHRGNDFLPNDSDIDIDICDDRDVYAIIRRMPFEPLFVTSCKGRYMQFAFWDSAARAVFDLWFYYESQGKLYNRNYYGYFWLPAPQIAGLQRKSFGGRDYPMPDPDWYCRFWYGENWREPKQYGEDWSVDYRKDCTGFIYTGEKNLTFLDCYKK